jgi:hypothetical protein
MRQACNKKISMTTQAELTYKEVARVLTRIINEWSKDEDPLVRGAQRVYRYHAKTKEMDTIKFKITKNQAKGKIKLKPVPGTENNTMTTSKMRDVYELMYPKTETRIRQREAGPQSSSLHPSSPSRAGTAE